MKTGLIALMSLTACLAMAEDDRPIVDASTLVEEQSGNKSLPTLYIVGDSTVRSGGKNGMFGWGERIGPFFDPEKINVANKAIGGRSARTYYREKRWEAIENELRKGDFVIIQFGHNDGGRVGDPANKHRADLPGTGDETAPDEMEDGTIEQVHTFGWYLTQFVTGAKAKGATVIICSPVPHKDRWEKGRDFEGFAEWGKEVAKDNGVYFLDLTMVVTDAYKKVGRDAVENFFADQRTHTTEAGATFNAACVVAGLKSLQGNPMHPYLSDQGKKIDRFRD